MVRRMILESQFVCGLTLATDYADYYPLGCNSCESSSHSAISGSRSARRLASKSVQRAVSSALTNDCNSCSHSAIPLSSCAMSSSTCLQRSSICFRLMGLMRFLDGDFCSS